MKKNLTLLSVILLATSSFGQTKITEYKTKSVNASEISTDAVSKQTVSEEKAVGTPFYTNNFDNAGDWTINNSGQTGATFGWTIDAVKDGWWAPATAIASTSEGNFAELTNGDPTIAVPSQALNVTYTVTSANPISLNGNGTNVSLSFQQFGARFNDLQEMMISTNGTTWVTVGNNLNYDVLSQTGGAAYPNPDTKSINLSSFLLPTDTQIWIRFSWTTNFPAQATNANVWVAYGWYIDDVKLSTNSDYDLSSLSNFWGSAGVNYYKIPLEQIAPIDFAASLVNNGSQALNAVKLNITANPGAVMASSTPVVLAPAGAVDAEVLAGFTPPGAGTFTINRTLTTTEVDDVPTNNQLSNITFTTGGFMYERDNGTFAGNTSNGTDIFEVGNIFDIYTEATLKAITFRLATGSTNGIEVQGKLYDATVDPFVLVDETPFYITSSTDVNQIRTLNFPGSGVTVEAGKTYILALASGAPGMKVSNAGTSYDQTSFIYDHGTPGAGEPGTWFFQTATPVVRMNFNPVIGLEENTFISDLSISPNPTANETMLSFNLKETAEVSVVVTDMAGRTVQTIAATEMNAGTQDVIVDATTFEAGMYTVNLTVGTQTITKRIVKN